MTPGSRIGFRHSPEGAITAPSVVSLENDATWLKSALVQRPRISLTQRIGRRSRLPFEDEFPLCRGLRRPVWRIPTFVSFEERLNHGERLFCGVSQLDEVTSDYSACAPDPSPAMHVWNPTRVLSFAYEVENLFHHSGFRDVCVADGNTHMHNLEIAILRFLVEEILIWLERLVLFSEVDEGANAGVEECADALACIVGIHRAGILSRNQATIGEPV